MGVAIRMNFVVFRGPWSSTRMSTHWSRPQNIEDKIPSAIEMDRKTGTMSCILAPEVSESFTGRLCAPRADREKSRQNFDLDAISNLVNHRT